MALPFDGDAEELIGGQKKLFYRIRRTLLEMLHDRGYLIADADLHMTFDEFLERYKEPLYRSALDFSRFKREDHSKMIFVFFVEKKLVKTKLDHYVGQIKAANATNGIFVVQGNPPASLKNALSLDAALDLEIFMESELMVNVSHHFLVPKHEALTSEEKQILLEGYNGDFTELPHILEGDPQAKYLGLKRGDVVKITRDRGIDGKQVVHRLVV